MASPYDAYRLAPQSYQNPMQTQGSAQHFYAPSDSVWGNLGQKVAKPLAIGGLGVGAAAGLGAAGIGTGVGGAAGGLALTGGAGAGAGALAALGPIGAAAAAYMLLANGQDAFGGANEIKDGQFFKNLGRAQNWGDFATFGITKAKRAQRDAANARRAAVENWRRGQLEQLGGRMGQKGQDVQEDLGGELRDALYAGGDMGDEGAINDAMTKFQQRYQQYMLGRQRAGQARQVDAMFADPGRTNDRNQRLNAEREQGLGQLAEQYRIGQRNNAFNQARRGTMGSSMDVEQQGEMGRARNTGAMALQSGLDEKARAFRLNDQQQQNTLKGLIYADDPNTAQAFSRTLEGLNAQGNLINEQSAMRSQMAARQGAISQGYSQAIGGALTAASRPLEQYLDHRGSGA
jgi:hypothetical protein